MGAVRKSKRIRAALLEAFRDLGTIQGAAKAVGVDRRTHYRWMQKDPEYRRDFDDCADETAGLLMDELVSRAIHGWDEPVFHAGKRAMDFARDANGELVKGPDNKFIAVPATIKRKSDACLLALASARLPGFNPRLDHRFVDKAGRDRRMDVESVRAYMKSGAVTAADEE